MHRGGFVQGKFVQTYDWKSDVSYTSHVISWKTPHECVWLLTQCETVSAQRGIYQWSGEHSCNCNDCCSFGAHTHKRTNKSLHACRSFSSFSLPIHAQYSCPLHSLQVNGQDGTFEWGVKWIWTDYYSPKLQKPVMRTSEWASELWTSFLKLFLSMFWWWWAGLITGGKSFSIQHPTQRKTSSKRRAALIPT